jgi:uncharacterized protein HemX
VQFFKGGEPKGDEEAQRPPSRLSAELIAILGVGVMLAAMGQQQAATMEQELKSLAAMQQQQAATMEQELKSLANKFDAYTIQDAELKGRVKGFERELDVVEQAKGE